MNANVCRTCGFYDWEHPKDGCPPAYMMWRPENAETEADAKKIHGTSPEDAIERWADRDDADGDYCIVNGSEATVMVKDSVGVVTRWVVSGEAVPTYTAREAK